MLLRRPSKKPVRTRERYILDSLPKIFKGGGWVEDPPKPIVSPSQKPTSPDRGGGGSAQENGSGGRTEGNSTGTRYITVIGGQGFYEQALYDALEPFQHYIVGAGRGVESHIAKTYFDGEYTVVPLDPDRYGKNARKVNVESVLVYAIDSPLLLVGNGERVKQARAWLERTNSRREVVELP